MKLSRREILASVGAAALTAATPKLADAAGFLFLAGHPATGGGGGGGPGGGFNGGKTQINLNFASSSQTPGEFPFINVLKTMPTPGSVNALGPVPPTMLTSNGYPGNGGGGSDSTTIFDYATYGGLSTTIIIPSYSEKPGTWNLKWVSGDSNAKFSVNGVTYGPGASQTVTGISIPQTNINFSITGGTLITDVALYHSNDATDYGNGKWFTSDFVNKLKALNPGVIRFLNWEGQGGCEFSNVAYWADRKPTTFLYWAGMEPRASMYAGTTSGTGQTYTASAPPGWGGLVDKAPVIIKADHDTFIGTGSISSNVLTIATVTRGVLNNGDLLAYSAYNSASPPVVGSLISGGGGAGSTFNISGASDLSTTNIYAIAQLNIGGTGAKSVVFEDNIVNTGTGFRSRSDAGIGHYAFLRYDADLGNWIKMGLVSGSAGVFDVFLDNGVPYEVQLELANEVGAHPWFVAPVFACDPVTDWYSGIATYMAANQPSWMIPRYEITPNEQFNFPSLYSIAKAKVHWPAGSSQFDNWAGYVGSKGGQAINTAYGSPTVATQTKYQAISGIQGLASAINDARLASTSYVGGTGQSGYINGSAASNWLTHVCSATYIGSDQAASTFVSNWSTLTGAQRLSQASAFAARVTNNTQPPYSPPGQVGQGTGYCLTQITAIASWAAGFGLKMNYYEGGYSSRNFDQTGDAADWLRILSLYGANLTTDMTNFYASLEALPSEFPSKFQLGGFLNPWSVQYPTIYSQGIPLSCVDFFGSTHTITGGNTFNRASGSFIVDGWNVNDTLILFNPFNNKNNLIWSVVTAVNDLTLVTTPYGVAGGPAYINETLPLHNSNGSCYLIKYNASPSEWTAMVNHNH